VAQVINNQGAAIPCRLLKKSGNMARGLVHLGADNLTQAPQTCADRPLISIK
jgi:hypothetical protein